MTKTTGITPTRTVNTGAKDVPDLTTAIEKLAAKSKAPQLDKAPGKIVGQFNIFMGVDDSSTLLLVQGKSGKLSLVTQEFGIHPGHGHGMFNTVYQKIGDLGMALSTDGKFDSRAKAYAPFGKPGSFSATLKTTGYEIALSAGKLYVEKPNVHGPHTLLSVIAPS